MWTLLTNKIPNFNCFEKQFFVLHSEHNEVSMVLISYHSWVSFVEITSRIQHEVQKRQITSVRNRLLIFWVRIIVTRRLFMIMKNGFQGRIRPQNGIFGLKSQVSMYSYSHETNEYWRYGIYLRIDVSSNVILIWPSLCVYNIFVI